MTYRKLSLVGGLGLAAFLFAAAPAFAAPRGGGGGRPGGGGGGGAYRGGGGGAYRGVPAGGGAYRGGYGGYGGYSGYRGGYGGYGNRGYGYGLGGFGLGYALGSGLGYGGYGLGGYGRGYGYGGYGYGYGSPSYYSPDYGVAPAGYLADAYPAVPQVAPALADDRQSMYYDEQGQGPAPEEVNTAHIVVRVPANAKVWVGGAETTQTGEERVFASPQLTPGKAFTYEVKARWTQDGRPVEQTRRVKVRANQLTTVEFDPAEVTR